MIELDSQLMSREVTIKLKNLECVIERQINQTWFNIGDVLRKELQQQVSKGAKNGRIYRIKRANGRIRKHRASAAGETPARLTGKYRKNVGYQIQGPYQMEFGVGKNQGLEDVPYARALEEGYAPRNLRPRPGLKNAYRAKQQQVVVMLEQGIASGLD